jgi:large conductance mechanosensitive channel
MALVKEFREFIARGNVIDLAVGVIIGGAFGKIVSSLVNDVVMPPIGLLMNGVNFSDLFVPLNGEAYASLAEAVKAGAPVIAYGSFINTIIQFLIVAACVFAMIKVINRIKREEKAKPEPAPVEPPRSEKLLEEIRDLLKK